jgi:hypothetical protein
MGSHGQGGYNLPLYVSRQDGSNAITVRELFVLYIPNQFKTGQTVLLSTCNDFWHGITHEPKTYSPIQYASGGIKMKKPLEPHIPKSNDAALLNLPADQYLDNLFKATAPSDKWTLVRS